MNNNLTNMKKCSKCKICKSVDSFNKTGKYVASWCNECRARLEDDNRRQKGVPKRKKSVIKGDQKLCLGCENFKDFDLFSKSTRGLGGLSSYCKECFVKKYKVGKEYNKESVYSYRKRNKERYLAAHRLHQFTRKSKVKITDDGTVTDDFLKNLYNTEICYICLKYIEKEDRTADHVKPLSKGGNHSALNLKMACFTCNSSKGAK